MNPMRIRIEAQAQLAQFRRSSNSQTAPRRSAVPAPIVTAQLRLLAADAGISGIPCANTGFPAVSLYVRKSGLAYGFRRSSQYTMIMNDDRRLDPADARLDAQCRGLRGSRRQKTLSGPAEINLRILPKKCRWLWDKLDSSHRIGARNIT
jgi:hypothetical protein